ncbi:MAG: hypothetical protein DRJ49_04530 [Thermoprotei archaeon]|nr:MAG: hypothetical protein DRJ49_04530 [Thermoprotei archaeon]
MRYFELYLKSKETIKKNIDIRTLSEFQLSTRTYQYITEKLLLKAEIMKLRRDIEGKRMGEKLLTSMKISKLKDGRTRLVSKERTYWNYRMRYTKYPVSKLKNPTVSIIRDIQKVKNSLLTSLSYTDTWASTLRHSKSITLDLGEGVCKCII